MAKMLDSVKDLDAICTNEWRKLDEVGEEYLNEAGRAAMEAYKVVLWHLPFFDTFEDLKNSEELIQLSNIPGKHPEYYKILRKINRVIEESCK